LSSAAKKSHLGPLFPQKKKEKLHSTSNFSATLSRSEIKNKIKSHFSGFVFISKKFCVKDCAFVFVLMEKGFVWVNITYFI
jgi:hypothetical protein